MGAGSIKAPGEMADKASIMADTPNRLVLVVEDEAVVREALERFLQMRRFAVVTAATVPEALEIVRSHRLTGAIVDLRLPGGSGRDVVASLPSGVPVVIFSAAPEESGQLERVRPHTALVLKPYSLSLLVDKLTEMQSEMHAG